ncbi:MAG: S26 family signal peptidase [Methanomassiliicoccaceae archaeon]|nr:S26 family signal peptidase [Methanomassiliicoccaceae archaeon]
MERDTKHMLATISVFAVVIAVIFAGIFVTTGNFPPRTTVVESQSMQHGAESHIGIIDTADMVILRDKDIRPIRSYVDGYNSGYVSFGSYGDVIVYSRGANLNPVIHRAILWLDYNGDRTWSAPSLKNYPADLWSATSGNDYSRLSGTLTLNGFTNYTTGKNISLSLNLNSLVENAPHSGFISKGDYNTSFDQLSGIMTGLITEEQIQSVAWIEVPWAGVFRMVFVNDKLNVINEQVPNTIPCLAAAILLTIFLLIGISFFFDQLYYKKYKKELKKEMNARPPLFPVEPKVK